MGSAVYWAACGTGFTFAMTVLGAAVVFLFRKEIGEKVQNGFCGFAAGVMMAASVWSLLLPAIDSASSLEKMAWIPAAGGFALGGGFLYLLDRLLSKAFLNFYSKGEKGQLMSQERRINRPSAGKGTSLLIMAVTLHNIPEGMATGLAFALAAQNAGDPAYYVAALALAVGIGIQNLPEGSAVALPLRKDGVSAFRAFIIGSMSGIVEPIFGIGTTLLAHQIRPFMPWLLSFAAGAMIYVVAEELIPQAKGKENERTGTIGVMAGFLVMMILDVALG